MTPAYYLLVVNFVNGAVGRYLVDRLPPDCENFTELCVSANDGGPALISQGRRQGFYGDHVVSHELIELTLDQAVQFTKRKTLTNLLTQLPNESVEQRTMLPPGIFTNFLGSPTWPGCYPLNPPFSANTNQNVVPPNGIPS